MTSPRDRSACRQQLKPCKKWTTLWPASNHGSGSINCRWRLHERAGRAASETLSSSACSPGMPRAAPPSRPPDGRGQQHPRTATRRPISPRQRSARAPPTPGSRQLRRTAPEARPAGIRGNPRPRRGLQPRERATSGPRSSSSSAGRRGSTLRAASRGHGGSPRHQQTQRRQSCCRDSRRSSRRWSGARAATTSPLGGPTCSPCSGGWTRCRAATRRGTGRLSDAGGPSPPPSPAAPETCAPRSGLSWGLQKRGQ
mmetsp:Transcript_7541/g.18120  ORF Transcript_7541/g.18120 Transcript_7541/m.18120 type:complete len:255 (+) Transcript_7541:383-1147(+)